MANSRLRMDDFSNAMDEIATLPGKRPFTLIECASSLS